MKPGTARAFALRRRAHSRAPGPESLSLGSLGVATRTVRTTLLAFLSSALLVCATHAVSIGEDYAWKFSDAVVVGSVQSVSSVRLIQEWAGARFMLYRATVRPTRIDGVRVQPRHLSFFYVSPAPDPNSSFCSCPPYIALSSGKRFKLGGVLKEVQGVGRVLWIPSDDYTKLQPK